MGGFSGAWISGGTQFFNNEYYKKLVDTDLSWRNRDATSGEDTSHWQWNVAGAAFMLNVDVDGKSSCAFASCAAAPTATIVEAFAASNQVWITEFAKVFTKMQAHGATQLFDLSDD